MKVKVGQRIRYESPDRGDVISIHTRLPIRPTITATVEYIKIHGKSGRMVKSATLGGDHNYTDEVIVGLDNGHWTRGTYVMEVVNES